MVKYLDRNSGFNQWNAAKNAAVDNKKSRFSGFLWWFIIFLAAWWMIGYFMGPKKSVETNENVSAPVVDLSAVPINEIASDKLTARVQGLRISDIQLKDFAANANDMNGARVTLLGGNGDYAEIGYVSTAAVPTPTTVWRGMPDKMTWRDAAMTFARSIETDGYVIRVSDQITNNTKSDVAVAPYARIVRGADVKSSAGVKTGAIAYVNLDVEYRDWREMNKKSYAYSTTNGFIGFADQYWETVAEIDAPDQTMRLKFAFDKYNADAAASGVSVAPGETKTITTNIYAGPRDPHSLDAASNIITGLDDTIDYGWFWFLAQPLLWILNMLNALVHNYGIAIIILTLLLRFAMWPLTRKSYTSMMAMQKMQPEMARIQKLYANDKARLQMEMMRLYQTHKTSPMSGCLPMLLQIPIFFALYKALLVSVQMRSAHFLWISDLAAMDPYFILPILMGATMWWQSRLQTASKSPAAAGDAIAQTQRVMKWMPVMFTILFAWMPAGLVLYWTVSNLFGIAQMYVIKKRGQ